jgi:circadian clock protein KaiB
MSGGDLTPGAPLKLRLYVMGDSPGAQRALQARKRLVQECGPAIAIEVVDVLSCPQEAERVGILATPTLSDESTEPPRRLIGDLSELSQVLDFFGFRRKDFVP